MNAHMKTLLNISGITKRDHHLLLVCVGKVCGNTFKLRLVYPSIGSVPAIRYPDNQPEINSLAPAVCFYLF
jgi:hypothetical protein